jgi:hypothetical protein
MLRRLVTTMAAITMMVPAAAEAERPASLRGSPASMQEQNRVARDLGLTFYRTDGEILRAVDNGQLVALKGNSDYEVADFVRFPYLQPEGVLFVERLAAQYRDACGQKLVVTSAVRPSNGQPSNAHALSVHPAGMAVDLRVSDRAACRSWLESAILNLERSGVINGIREYRPPHYHIAIYPREYLAYAEERMAIESEVQAEPTVAAPTGVLVGSASSALVAGPSQGRPEAAAASAGRNPAITIAALALALPFGIGYILRRRRP